MKFLGKVQHPKDLTTKEYVDSADAKLRDSLEDKLDPEDIQEYSAEEVADLWDSAFTSIDAEE